MPPTTNTNSKEKKPDTMNKSEMVTWLFQNHNILDWPGHDDEYMSELKKQWAIFGEYHKNKKEYPDELICYEIEACSELRIYY